jgi:hypothetical protein
MTTRALPRRAPPPHPALQLHRAHLRRDPPPHQGHRPSPRRDQLPHLGLGRPGPRLPRLARPDHDQRRAAAAAGLAPLAARPAPPAPATHRSHHPGRGCTVFNGRRRKPVPVNLYVTAAGLRRPQVLAAAVLGRAGCARPAGRQRSTGADGKPVTVADADAVIEPGTENLRRLEPALANMPGGPSERRRARQPGRPGERHALRQLSGCLLRTWWATGRS